MTLASAGRAAAIQSEALRDRVIEVRDLVKRYGDTEVVQRISFDVHRGELFGLLGTNGAGKTTTVEILQGLRRPTSGHARVLGLDPAAHGDRLRRLVGAQLQDSALPDRLRVGEAVQLFASLQPQAPNTTELIEEWNLAGILRRPFGALSGGERQRLFVALALISRPAVVFLDELTQNLDPVARRHTWDVVRRVRDAGTTVVLVTHDVEEAERLCDRLVVMHQGRVVADGSPRSIVEALGGAATVRFTEAGVDARILRDLPGVHSVHRHGPEVRVTGTGAVLAHVAARLVSAGFAPEDLRVERPSLEDRFVALLEREPTDSPVSVTSGRTDHAHIDG